jgi:hypothetical protein
MKRKRLFWVVGTTVLPLLLLFACSKITAPADVTPPATPTTFILLGGGDGEARFRWAPNSEEDFRYYLIYRAIGSPVSFVSIAEITGNEFVDRFLDYETTYYYYITAVDYANNESPASGILDVKPVNISSPASPTSVVVYGHNNASLNQVECSVSWIPPTISDLSHFRVYRSTNALFEADASTLIDSTSVSLYRDIKVATGELYHYRIVCVDLGGRASVASQADHDRILDKVTLLLPGNRTIQTATLTFSWQPIANAVGYQVFVGRAPLSNVIWTSKVTTSQQLAYTGSKLSNDALYYWWVGAYSKGSGINQNGVEVEPDVNSTSEIWSFFVR